MEQGPLSFSPGLRTPTGRTCGARQGGDGHRALTRSYATDICRPPICELTRDVRPRVAAEVSNLSLGTGVYACVNSKAHLPTSAPLSGPGTRPDIRPVIHQPPEGVPGRAVAVSCCVSAAGIRFLGTLSCQTEFRPHCCRPTTTDAHTRVPAVDPGRVYTFPTREIRTGPGALYTPGTAVFIDHRNLRGRRLSPHNDRSLPSRHRSPTRDVILTRHQREFPGSRPSGPSPHL
jgi:hypothetical protein